MISIVWVMIYNLAWTILILPTFSGYKNNFLKPHNCIQQKKFNKVEIECKSKQDAEKVIFNFFNVSLTEAEKSLLVKSLSFSLSPKKL